ncbi:ABC transporter permease [Desulfovibrio aminophilus]|uniref:ABC transporter permease n=1 Tax=Desulfovibrio aminophilus TaxID=81425 RepID=UPI00339A0C06
MINRKRLEWYRDLLLVLLRKDLSVRYHGSVLGYLWSLLNPLAQTGIYLVVFGHYMRFNMPHYTIVLLSALFPWQWISNSIMHGPVCFIANPTLIKKVAFPKAAIPLVANIQDMIHFFISIPVYFAFMITDGICPGISSIWSIPLLSFVTLATVYGLNLLIGSVNIFFKDLGHIVGIIMNALFFGSPIIYTLDIVPVQFHIFIKMNPLAPIIICWRSALFNGAMAWDYFGYAVLYASFFMLMGIVTYSKVKWKFAEAM